MCDCEPPSIFALYIHPRAYAKHARTFECMYAYMCLCMHLLMDGCVDVRVKVLGVFGMSKCARVHACEYIFSNYFLLKLF